jgi:translation elongation factor EF-Tu-like GTPase
MLPNLAHLTAVASALIVSVVAVSGCSKKPPEAVSFKANSPIPVGFTLLKAEGQVGRSGAISNNYRPQVRFPRGSVETTCAVVLPASSPALEPGQTTDASLACDSQIEVEPSQREFTVFEGGKQVAQGTVRLP